MMTYLSIIKGKMIETTGGDYNIYAKESIIYNSAKTISETGEKNGIIYGKPQNAPIIDRLKKIIEVKWMCFEMENTIYQANVGEKVSLLVKTKNFKEGETVTIIVDEVNGKDVKADIKEITYSGKVNAEGFAELKQQVEL